MEAFSFQEEGCSKQLFPDYRLAMVISFIRQGTVSFIKYQWVRYKEFELAIGKIYS